MAQHTHYWSCSKFANWIRGTPKLWAGTSKEWREWHKAAKKAHPWRYWIAEEALDEIQDFVTWPVRAIYDIKYYCINRWVTRTNSLTAHPDDIKPGNWLDVGNRILPCLFNELVDFVEIETAWMHVAWGDEERAAKYNVPWNASGWCRTRTWRCPQAGLDRLEWASKLTWPEDDPKGELTRQALNAIEIRELYNWWKNVRPVRPDPYEVSGWHQISEERRAARLAAGEEDDIMSMLDEDRTDEQRVRTRAAHDRITEIEAQYEQEDTDMLIRLIKIRDGLST